MDAFCSIFCLLHSGFSPFFFTFPDFVSTEVKKLCCFSDFLSSSILLYVVGSHARQHLTSFLAQLDSRLIKLHHESQRRRRRSRAEKPREAAKWRRVGRKVRKKALSSTARSVFGLRREKKKIISIPSAVRRYHRRDLW